MFHCYILYGYVHTANLNAQNLNLLVKVKKKQNKKNKATLAINNLLILEQFNA